jgi:hypothetical protein
MTCSFKPQFTITNRLTQAITGIEQARSFLEAAQLSADWVRELGEQALIRKAHHPHRGHPVDYGPGRTAVEGAGHRGQNGNRDRREELC